MSEEPGLREKKKNETRRLLSAIALRLFAERGFEAVRVAEIAAEAGVSEKTVFNYFPTKEDLVLARREESEAELLRTIRERAAGESILTAVRRHTRALAGRLHALPAEHRAAFRKMVLQSPTVQERMRQVSAHYEEELAKLLAQETAASPGDPQAQVAARVLGILVRLALCGMTGWPDAKRTSQQETLARIDAAFDLIGAGLDGYGVRGKR